VVCWLRIRLWAEDYRTWNLMVDQAGGNTHAYHLKQSQSVTETLYPLCNLGDTSKRTMLFAVIIQNA
jgi:hypothetical protein